MLHTIFINVAKLSLFCSGEPRSPFETIVKSFQKVNLNFIYKICKFKTNKLNGEHGSPLQTIHNFHHIKAYEAPHKISSGGCPMNAPTPTDSIQNKNCINAVSGIGAIPLSNYLLKRTAVVHRSPKFSICQRLAVI